MIALCIIPKNATMEVHDADHYMDIDQLLKSIIYIISKKNLDEKRLVKEIDNYLNDIFLKIGGFGRF